MANSGDATSGIAVCENPGEIWRVGFRPDPWEWVDWAQAANGLFNGRWDSPDSSYRTIYAGTTLLSCLVEVLARFRPDPTLQQKMARITVDEADASLYASSPAGIIDESWLTSRRASRATLAGRYCDVGNSVTIAVLRPQFIDMAVGLFGMADFDSSALQASHARRLTQRVGRAIFELPDDAGLPAFDGIRFQSRHGNNLELWSIFERSTDGAISGRLSHILLETLRPDHPDIETAMRLHGLSWG